eukprot:TRINITY_DN4986_c0_g1_i6.p1 TRINITY_DN4986_c0_g1~~TRINITY_DN4986_c0_g1_i6.p1  ORF type:complete len:1636 (+),score=306.35 TRINITY_DN4986_c0_g1_i6:100-5007(+)
MQSEADANANANANVNANVNANGETAPTMPPPSSPPPDTRSFFARCRSNLHEGVIQIATLMHPSSKLRLLYEMVMFLATLYTIIVVPFRSAFGWSDFMRSILFLDYLVDFLFWVEILLNFYTPQTMDEVMRYDPKMIALRYRNSRFAFDLISQLPYDIFAVGFGMEALRYLRLPRMIRVVKLYKYVEKWEMEWKSLGSYFRIVLIFSILILVSHWIACVWWIVGISAPNEADSGWISGAGVADKSISTQYTTSLYWSIVVLTTVGYGDITAQNDAEKFVAICTMLTGAFFYGLLFGNIASVISTMDAASSRLLQKASKLHRYMSYHKLPDDLRVRIQNYFDIMWSRERGLDEFEITHDLPTALRSEVAVYIHRDLVNKVSFFRATHNAGFINSLVLNLKPQIALPGEVILREGDLPNEMFFLSRGTVEITQNGKILSVLRDGSYFGEVSLIFQERRTATVAAVEYCEMLMLTKADFDNSIKYFPEFGKFIRDIAQERRNINEFHSDAELVNTYLKKSRENEKKKDKSEGKDTSRFVSVVDLYRQQRRRSVAIAQNLRGVKSKKAAPAPVPLDDCPPSDEASEISERRRSRIGSLSDSTILGSHEKNEKNDVHNVRQSKENRRSSGRTSSIASVASVGESKRFSITRFLRSMAESGTSDTKIETEKHPTQKSEPDLNPGLQAPPPSAVPLVEIAAAVPTDHAASSSSDAQSHDHNANATKENILSEPCLSSSGDERPLSHQGSISSHDSKVGSHADQTEAFDNEDTKNENMVIQGIATDSMDRDTAIPDVGTGQPVIPLHSVRLPPLQFEDTLLRGSNDGPHYEDFHQKDPSLTPQAVKHMQIMPSIPQSPATQGSLESPMSDAEPTGVEVPPRLTPLRPKPNMMERSKELKALETDIKREAFMEKYGLKKPSAPSSVSSEDTENVTRLSLKDLEPRKSKKTGQVEVQSTSLMLLTAYGASYLPLGMGIKHKPLPVPFVIQHDSMFRRILTGCTIASIIYNIWAVPVRIGFHRDMNGRFLAVDYLTDAILILDVICNFYTTIPGRDGAKIINPFVIQKNYRRTWFWRDILASVPLDFFALPYGISILGYLRLPRLIRASRLVHYAQKLEQRLQLNPSLFRICKLFALFLTYAHVMACLAHIVPNIGDRDEFTLSGDEERPLYSKYLSCLYFATTTICTVGFGDITPNSDLSRQFMIIMMLFGSVMYSTVFGSMVSLVSSINSEANANQQKLINVEEYMKLRDLPPDLRQRIRNYYDIIWNRHKGLNESDILDQLPHNLRSEVALFLYKDTLLKVNIFQGINNISFINSIVLMLRPQMALPGEYVIRQGEIGQEMYFIVSGQVQISTDGKHIATLSSGAYFGEISLIFSQKRTASVIAEEYCELLMLRKKELDEVLDVFPEYSTMLKSIAKDRMKQQTYHSDGNIVMSHMKNQGKLWGKLKKGLKLKSSDSASPDASQSANGILSRNGSLIEGGEEGQRPRKQSFSDIIFRRTSSVRDPASGSSSPSPRMTRAGSISQTGSSARKPSLSAGRAGALAKLFGKEKIQMLDDDGQVTMVVALSELATVAPQGPQESVAAEAATAADQIAGGVHIPTDAFYASEHPRSDIVSQPILEQSLELPNSPSSAPAQLPPAEASQ